MDNRFEFIKQQLYTLHGIPYNEFNTVKKCCTKKNISSKFIKDNYNFSEDFFIKLDEVNLLTEIENLKEIYFCTENKFIKIKAAMFLSRLYGFYLPNKLEIINFERVPYSVINAIEHRQFAKAIEILSEKKRRGIKLTEATMKALSIAYKGIALDLIEEQIIQCTSNRYPQLFNCSSINKYILRNPKIYREKIEMILMPVRIELTSCIGSDLFFLAMDRPQKARCINMSVNLFDNATNSTTPPINVMVRPTHEYGIRITSIDLQCSKLITSFEDIFNMRNDNLSLLKAAVIASGIVPPYLQNNNKEFSFWLLLKTFMSSNEYYKGFEIITKVTNIPKGSGLAVSTNLLTAIIFALMRFSGQFSLESTAISEEDKMNVAARCIYAEWLGGSGGGWQDIGGMWPGIKIIIGQKANPELELHSAGSFLPNCRVLTLSNSVVSEMLEAFVLVNGGTGQNVGQVLKIITEQYILKKSYSWTARLRAENRFTKLLESIKKGDAKRFGQLKSADFKDRKCISHLASNIYHDQVYNKIKSIFKDDLWGFDSSGGRAGAGGLFIINPTIRKEFICSFLKQSEKAQKEFEGQIHFASKALIHNFQLNNVGIQLVSYSQKQANVIISSWKKFGKTNAYNNKDNIKTTKNFIHINEFDKNVFAKLQAEYISGKISLEKNVKKGGIYNIDHLSTYTQIKIMPEFGQKPYKKLFKSGIKLCNEPIAYIILNGGENTRFGSKTIRSLNPAFYIEGKYCSLLELKFRHIAFLSDHYGASIYPVLVNGFLNNNITMKLLQKNNFYGISKNKVYNCFHQISSRIIPKIEDIMYWHQKNKSLSKNEENLANQYMEFAKQWAQKNGEGKIYKSPAKNKLNTFVSPGHYYSFMSLISQFILGKLIKKGVKTIIVSSNDNILATVDFAILAYHKKLKSTTTCEIVPRILDKGGSPVLLNGKIKILEDFLFPTPELLWNASFFNTMTTWIEIEAFVKSLGLTKYDLIKAAEGEHKSQKICNDCVSEMAEKLPTYVVLKYLLENLSNGNTVPFPVIQFEKLYGDFINLLNPTFLIVPKMLRHTQVKSLEDIHNLIENRALELIRPQIMLN